MRFMIFKKIKSSFIGCLIVMFLSSLSLVIFWDKAVAQSQEELTAKLVEGAKKEGKMVLYTAMSVDDAQKFLEGFKKKYPFIATEVYRAGSEKLLYRVLNESKAKKYFADVLKDNFTILISKKEGLGMKYVSPESKSYPEGFKDPEGFWTAVYLVTRVLGYNTKLVDTRDVPKRNEDLLDPKWKGKIGMDAENSEWFFMQLKTMGREKGIEFMKKLAGQDIQFRTGKTLLTQLLSAGEFSIGVGLNGHQVEKLKGDGAPIGWVAIEPVVTLISPIMVMANAPHPNAAKLFMDFVLSLEGQKIVRSFNRIPVRPDVLPDPPRLTQGVKLTPLDPSFVENMEEYNRLYRDIFLKRADR